MIVELTLGNTELQYIKSIFVKSFKQTINAIIAKYIKGAARLDVTAVGYLEVGARSISIRLDDEKAEFIRANFVANKAYTVRAIINFVAKQATNKQ
jgi:hypothetical protein